MNIAITGSNGFIGSWLINEMLRTEHHLTAFVRTGKKAFNNSGNSKLIIKEVDYENDAQVLDALLNIDVLIHLIGQMGEYGIQNEEFQKTNVDLTKKLLILCENAQVKQFVFCSTPGVQGFGKRLAVEKDNYAPRNIYEITKMDAEREVIDFCSKSTMKYTIIRPDFVYGPGDVRRVKMYKSIQNRKFILTTNGKSYLHPTYITDVTQGFIKVIHNKSAFNQIFNISAGQDITSLNYLKTISKCVGSPLIHINIGYKLSKISAGMFEWIFKKILHKDAFVSKNKIDFLAMDHSTSNEKARKLINYEPCVSLEEGMKETIKWCRENNLLGE